MVHQPAYRSSEGLLPQNVEAEQAVLGSLLIDPRAIEQVAPFLRPDDFYLPVNAQIYRGMLALHERDMPTDIVTLSDHLHAQDRLDDVGGPAYLASLANIVPTSINVEYYARIVERLAVLRRLVDAGNRISAIGYDERLEAETALEEAEKVLFEISRMRVTRDFAPLSQILAEVYEKLDHIHSHESEITGITTGYVDLDRLTSGFQRSDLIILAARPSQGKTAMALNIAHAVAVKAGLPVGIFSVEMSAEQLAQRLISIQAQIESQKLRSGRMSDDDWDRLVQAVGVLSEAPIFVDDTPALAATEMRSKARRLHTEQGLGLLIVDYLQLMQGATSENRVQEISAISRALKAVARELDVPVLALSQLSRAPEQRPGHEPVLSDLRDSGCLAGEALVYLPDEGVHRRIDELVGRSGFNVLALNPESWRLEPRRVLRAFPTGRKPVYQLKLRIGRSVRATANHQFLTLGGWKRLDELAPGERIALPCSAPGSVAQPSVAAATRRSPWRVDENVYWRHQDGAPPPSRPRRAALLPLACDVLWDEIASIEPDSEADVFDLTVEGLHNFVANGVVVHNSIEQDADIVMFIYRDVMYNPDTERPHVADVLVAKHRNGPTGKISLFFQESLMKFFDLRARRDE